MVVDKHQLSRETKSGRRWEIDTVKFWTYGRTKQVDTNWQEQVLEMKIQEMEDDVIRLERNIFLQVIKERTTSELLSIIKMWIS